MIARKDKLIEQMREALVICKRIAYPNRGTDDEFADINDFAAQIQQLYSLEEIKAALSAAERGE